jgi:hypothetical protein
MNSTRISTLGAIALAMIAACSKDHGKAATPRDAVLDAWKADKHVPAAPLTAAKVDFAGDCQTGAIENLDVLLCNLGSQTDATAAENAGLAWVGSVTGASQARGAALIVLADRKKADPSGRMINKLLKLAPK